MRIAGLIACVPTQIDEIPSAIHGSICRPSIILYNRTSFVSLCDNSFSKREAENIALKRIQEWPISNFQQNKHHILKLARKSGVQTDRPIFLCKLPTCTYFNVWQSYRSNITGIRRQWPYLIISTALGATACIVDLESLAVSMPVSHRRLTCKEQKLPLKSTRCLRAFMIKIYHMYCAICKQIAYPRNYMSLGGQVPILYIILHDFQLTIK